MRMYDVIAKKRDGGTLNHDELAFAVNGYVAGDVPDYQMSALLMAIYLRGMTDEETAMLTDVMAHSGDMVDLSAIAGIKADKHSTGGVGDKTTLVIAPIVAACGVKIAKMSGRGLGHTGGTIDKMEAVPGTRTSLTQEEFFRQVNEIGISVIGEAPVKDKKYNLFDHPNLKYTPDYRSPRGLLHRFATPIPAPEGYTMPPDYMAQAGTASLAYVAELTCPEITEDLYDELQELEESLL